MVLSGQGELGGDGFEFGLQIGREGAFGEITCTLLDLFGGAAPTSRVVMFGSAATKRRESSSGERPVDFWSCWSSASWRSAYLPK